MAQATELKSKPKSHANGRAGKLLEGLNREQEKAVTHREGPLLIVAGAGTGKTTVITRRIAYLIEQGVKPEEILALAFGEKAAGEMEERVDQLVPHGFVGTHISTFHAFGEQILKEHGLEIGLPDFKVLDEVGQWLLVRSNLDKFDLEYYRPLGNPAKFIKAMISHFSRLKDEMINPEQYLDYAEKQKLALDQAEAGLDARDEAKRLEEIATAFHVYNKLLLENSALDFADLINYSLELFKKRPRILEMLRKRFKYILVDEFQDTNLAQYELIKLLALPANNITVVGDDDQSIFKFRGASISNILHFQRDYPDTQFISLADNYRSGQTILDAAYKFIQQNNPDRLEVKLKLSKKLKSHTEGEGAIKHLKTDDYLDEVDEVIDKIIELKEKENLNWNDFAILTRSHGALEPFLNKFEAIQIPYMYFANKGLYGKPIILDMLSYFRLLDNYHESAALYRVLKFPIFQIKSAAIIEMSAFAKRKSLSLYAVLKQASSFEFDDTSREGIKKLLAMIEVHAETARRKTAERVFVDVVNDLHFAPLLDPETLVGAQNSRYLETFRRKIQDFQNESPDKFLKTLLDVINKEQEAGEEGDIEFDPDSGPEAVKFMTVHAAKGLEFTHVFVVNMVDKRFPTIERREQIEIPVDLIRDILPEGDAHIEEERRLFYVAMTRAKKGLFLTSADDYGGKRSKRPSRFLVELGLVSQQVQKAKPTGKVKFAPSPQPSPARGEGVIPLPLPKYFSFSQISLFKKCPIEYKYQYIMKLPLPGAAQLSFGSTIHKTFEHFLKHMLQSAGPDLFGESPAPELPSFELLQKLYAQSWIDDWYESRQQMEKYHAVGQKILKDFYEECKANKPTPKYLEKPFKLRLDKYYFTGKIDRLDETAQGALIIDYKTGAARDIEKVDKDQLLVYQWAAQDLLSEKVADLQYWYLKDRLEKRSFLGSEKEIEKLKESLLETIEEIIQCTKQNDFLKRDQQTSHKGKCKYLELEL